MKDGRVAEVLTGPENAGKRLDQVLGSHRLCSRSAARRLIAAGAVWVDGRRVKVAGRRMRPGQRIVAHLDAAPQRTDVDLKSRILYADDRMIAVNKPAGMVSSPTPRSDKGALTTELGLQLNLQRPPMTVGRLDRDTSGVIVLALNRTAARILTELMTRGQVRKEYLAFCSGRPEPDQGMWDWPLGADLRRVGRFLVDPKRGRPARTVFDVAGPCQDLQGVWEFHLRLLTGRTHQIRVHAAQAGCPVLGDRWYGGATEVFTNDDRSLKVWNLALHSCRWAVDADDWPGHLHLTCEPDEPFPLLGDKDKI